MASRWQLEIVVRERRIGIIVNGATGRMSRNRRLKHAPVAIRDAGGKHAYCAKPIATTSAEARELAELADGGARMLDGVPPFRCMPADRAAPIEHMSCNGVNRSARRGVDAPASGATS